MLANGSTICNGCGHLVHAVPGHCELCGEPMIRMQPDQNQVKKEKLEYELVA